jgi:hypothetical protein
MSVGDLVRELIDAGTDPAVAADVVARAAIAGASMAPATRSAGAIRQERYRRNKASQVTQCDASSPEEMSPTPPETQPSPTVPPSPPKGGGFPLAKPDPAEALEIFNRHAALAGWPKARMTDERRPKLLHRVEEAGGMAGWDRALERARGSPFLTGDNRDGWKAGLDFFLQKSSFNKLLEGSYDGKRNGNHQRQHRPASGHDNVLTALDELLGGGDHGSGGTPGTSGAIDAERDAEGIYQFSH